MRTPVDLSLYLVLDPDLCRAHSMVETAALAMRGGASVVQLRGKRLGTAGLVEIGHALKAALGGAIPLIVNDDVEAAIAVGADGLHVGQDDMPPAQARGLIGPDMILGLSVSTEAQVRSVDPAIVDHCGVGPVFATPTKGDHNTPIGFEGLKRLVALCPVPTVAIGGLKRDHVAAALAAGAQGVAVVSAICGQPDPLAATRDLALAIRQARGG